MSVGMANTVINTIVADVLCDMADELEKAGDFDSAVRELIRRTISEHRRILYNGNGYSQEWVEEAARRGLPNIKSMVEAIPALVTEKAINLFERHKVFSKSELIARRDVLYDSYSKAINIEAKTMISMASSQYIPAVIKYVKLLADSISAVRNADADIDTNVQEELLKEASDLLAEARAALKDLSMLVNEAEKITCFKEKAEFFYYKVRPVMSRLREPIDALERIVDRQLWPVPGYGELLYEL